MVGAATSRLAKSSAIGGIAGAAAVTIAGIVVTIATAGAAGAPSAAAIMGVAGSTAGLVGAATGTRSKIGQAKLGGKWSEYQAEVQSALGQREVQIQDDQTQIRIEAFEELEDEVELASMMRNKARGRIIGLSFYAGLGIIGLSLFARARK
jgi:hypothetical protein